MQVSRSRSPRIIAKTTLLAEEDEETKTTTITNSITTNKEKETIINRQIGEKDSKQEENIKDSEEEEESSFSSSDSSLMATDQPDKKNLIRTLMVKKEDKHQETDIDRTSKINTNSMEKDQQITEEINKEEKKQDSGRESIDPNNQTDKEKTRSVGETMVTDGSSDWLPQNNDRMVQTPNEITEKALVKKEEIIETQNEDKSEEKKEKILLQKEENRKESQVENSVEENLLAEDYFPCSLQFYFNVLSKVRETLPLYTWLDLKEAMGVFIPCPHGENCKWSSQRFEHCWLNHSQAFSPYLWKEENSMEENIKEIAKIVTDLAKNKNL